MLANDTSFQPPWWLGNPHIQSIYRKLFPYKSTTPATWETLHLPDGDFIDLVWVGDRTKPIVILLHGLEGSFHSSYIRSTADYLANHNWQSITMHFRGCSGKLNYLTKSYNACFTNDLEFLLDVISRKLPQQPVAVVGFSLGGNVILRYLEQQVDNRIFAAATISTPFDLAAAADYIPKFYQTFLLRSLKAKMKQKLLSNYPLPITQSQLARIATIREFDHLITAPVFGYASADDYYAQASSLHQLEKITCPTLLINAIDDPFIPASALPDPQYLPPNLELRLTSHGGHLGFIEGGKLLQPKVWYHSVLENFLAHTLNPL